ncbi:MepB family protein [Actinoplanes sp. NEAU-A12]|uniref:MepB family protein n=1 Tax=Actinoplanes sandaracinus TaxID=3045177 RepID=A0ABT6WPW0_9ACTN|nr:MepB family protein [Actinoplanes sandaracinus]MDI6101675.1 MepB family protein [Actinoplanes sandaracinus]
MSAPLRRAVTPHGTSVVTDPWIDTDPVHDDLRAAKALVYDPGGFVCSRPLPERESADYCAHSFLVNGLSVRFRTGRTTPTKIGQFVTLWARSESGPIRPLNTGDAVDLVVISTRDARHFGQFVFPLEALRERGIVASNHSGGKRGFRVYPPWVTTASRQAITTQAWQVGYFLSVDDGMPLDITRTRELYGVANRLPAQSRS